MHNVLIKQLTMTRFLDNMLSYTVAICQRKRSTRIASDDIHRHVARIKCVHFHRFIFLTLNDIFWIFRPWLNLSLRENQIKHTSETRHGSADVEHDLPLLTCFLITDEDILD